MYIRLSLTNRPPKPQTGWLLTYNMKGIPRQEIEDMFDDTLIPVLEALIEKKRKEYKVEMEMED